MAARPPKPRGRAGKAVKTDGLIIVNTPGLTEGIVLVRKHFVYLCLFRLQSS